MRVPQKAVMESISIWVELSLATRMSRASIREAIARTQVAGEELQRSIAQVKISILGRGVALLK